MDCKPELQSKAVPVQADMQLQELAERKGSWSLLKDVFWIAIIYSASRAKTVVYGNLG